MAQEYEQPVDKIASPLPQRMTAAESRAVIDLWQQEQVEQTDLTDKPALPDVAEGLDVTVEDVQRLLLEVRAQRLEEERALASEQGLSEIRLAEEERKLAEIRRQRAELRREQAETERRQLGGGQEQFPHTLYAPQQHGTSVNPLAIVAVVLTVLLLIMIIAANR